MDKERLLGWTPYIELIIRKIYYSDNKLLKRLINQIGKENPEKKKNSDQVKINTTEIYEGIKSLDITKGDILIVHTSKDELDKVGINPIELIKFLRGLIGEEGTLVLPAFPLYNKSNYDESRGIYIYNPQKTLCSTGMLPNLFLRMPNVMRSKFPWNSVAAQGPEAMEMMKHELESDLAHGSKSAWGYCMKHGAKILLLGVRASHTTTMVHVAEDLLDVEWPVKDWYEESTILLENKNISQEFKIRKRKQAWAKYNASWFRSNRLKKEGILYEGKIEGLNIGFIKETQRMIKYIIERTKGHKGFFVVPRRCYKTNEK